MPPKMAKDQFIHLYNPQDLHMHPLQQQSILVTMDTILYQQMPFLSVMDQTNLGWAVQFIVKVFIFKKHP